MQKMLQKKKKSIPENSISVTLMVAVFFLSGFLAKTEIFLITLSYRCSQRP